MTETYVLDACSLIAFFNDEKGAEIMEDLLIKALNQKAVLKIHIVNLLEIYYGIYRDGGSKKAEEMMDRVERLPVKIVRDISEGHFFEAGRLKATSRMSLADSIAASFANLLEAKLVTADHHEFDELENENKVRIYWIR